MRKCIYLIVTVFMIFSDFLLFAADDKNILIDDMNKMKNKLNGRCAVYQRSPSKTGFAKIEMERSGKKNKVLKIRFNKKSEGGPYGNGGWCGYYTLVKKGKNYLDVSQFKKLTFWVKGEKGGEKFKIGASDQAYESMDDSAKADDVSVYLPKKKITSEWQKAEISLDEIFIEWSMLASLSINFETDLYEDGSAKGIIYIDDIQFEK